MARDNEPDPEALAGARLPRVHERIRNRQERYVALLRLARHHRVESVDQRDYLEDAISDGEEELRRLTDMAGGRIMSRRRPRTGPPDLTNTVTVYIDECGTHSLSKREPFEAFVLAGVIVPDYQYPALNELWRKWKQRNLGSPTKVVHEPNLRKGNGSFWFEGDRVKRSQVRSSLKQLLNELPFSAIVCVVNRPEYVQEIGIEALDASLPRHPYLMAIQFLMERLVFVLDRQFNGARARIIAEGRGPLEDALFQNEYTRLLIAGTSYVSAAWFRQQLVPGVEFRTKVDNIAGLELADLLARPCGEKVMAPEETPERWPEFRDKLCQGQETMHSILGLKIVPWHEKYNDLWKS